MKLTFITLALLFTAAFTTSIAPGLYKITCASNGNVMDIEYGGTSDGSNLIIYPWHTGTNQQFTVNYVDGSWATLVAKNSGRALTVKSNSSGASFTQQTVTGNSNQQFSFWVAKDGSYLIKNRASGLVLNCNSDSKSSGSNRLAIQESRSCNANEKFTFTKLN